MSAHRDAHWFTLHMNARDDEGTPLRVNLEAVRRAAASLPMPERSWLFYSVSHPRWVLRTVGIVSVVVVIGMIGIAVSPRASVAQYAAVVMALPFPLLVVWGCVESSLRLRRARARYLPVCRAARVCGGCHYSLSGAPPDARGLTRCPECGLFWRLAPPPLTPPASHGVAGSPLSTEPPP